MKYTKLQQYKHGNTNVDTFGVAAPNGSLLNCIGHEQMVLREAEMTFHSFSPLSHLVIMF